MRRARCQARSAERVVGCRPLLLMMQHRCDAGNPVGEAAPARGTWSRTSAPWCRTSAPWCRAAEHHFAASFGGNVFTRRVLSFRAAVAVPLADDLKAQVAQLVEQRTENPRVGGSIPSLGTTP